jgi:hypothetical protein
MSAKIFHTKSTIHTYENEALGISVTIKEDGYFYIHQHNSDRIIKIESLSYKFETDREKLLFILGILQNHYLYLVENQAFTNKLTNFNICSLENPFHL